MKIGLLGGTFNPPHFGHIGISKEALDLLNLDEIWWLVTKQNPLKNSINNNFEKRVKLCQEISQNENKILVKDLEKNLKDSYFINLLKKILTDYQGNEYILIIGADNLINFHLWYKWQEILDLVKIAVFDRGNFLQEAKESKAAIFAKDKIIFLNNQKYNISSSKIRNLS